MHSKGESRLHAFPDFANYNIQGNIADNKSVTCKLRFLSFLSLAEHLLRTQPNAQLNYSTSKI